jgi:signal transduction histidine kinase
MLMAADRRAFVSSIRARTVAAACVVVSAALIVAAVLLVVILRRTMIRDVDNAARARAREVADLARQDSLPPVLVAQGRDDSLVQVIDGNEVIAASANVRDLGPLATFRPPGGGSQVRTLRGLEIEPDATDAFRVVGLSVVIGTRTLTVYVATNLEQVGEGVAAARRLVVIGVPSLIAIVALTSWQVVGRALRPVDAIRREVADINARDLGRRVPQPRSDDEIARLARTMNEMLDRLEAFTARQRRFVSDASHELQSPLAASLADLEVALAHPESADWKETAGELEQDNQRMTRLVQDLLFLARADERTAVAPTALVDLDDVVLVEAGRIRGHASVDLDTSAVTAAEIRGDADQLTRVVRNLLDNAARYAVRRIEVRLAPDGGDAVLVVSDDGPGVPAADAERIFERFARVDTSRSRGTGGAGLGLAIAREIIERHGGSIALDPDGNGASFVVRLPLA